MTKKKLKTEFEPGRGYAREDWDAVEAASFEATPEELAQAVSFAEAFPALAESIKRGRGRPATGKAREQISIRLDPDVISALKASGPGWQGRVNDALRRELGLGEAG